MSNEIFSIRFFIYFFIFSFQQAKDIFVLLSPEQQQRAATNGVAVHIDQLKKIAAGSDYAFIPQADSSGKLLTGR